MADPELDYIGNLIPLSGYPRTTPSQAESACDRGPALGRTSTRWPTDPLMVAEVLASSGYRNILDPPITFERARDREGPSNSRQTYTCYLVNGDNAIVLIELKIKNEIYLYIEFHSDII